MNGNERNQFRVKGKNNAVTVKEEPWFSLQLQQQKNSQIPNLQNEDP